MKNRRILPFREPKRDCLASEPRRIVITVGRSKFEVAVSVSLLQIVSQAMVLPFPQKHEKESTDHHGEEAVPSTTEGKNGSEGGAA